MTDIKTAYNLFNHIQKEMKNPKLVTLLFHLSPVRKYMELDYSAVAIEEAEQVLKDITRTTSSARVMVLRKEASHLVQKKRGGTLDREKERGMEEVKKLIEVRETESTIETERIFREPMRFPLEFWEDMYFGLYCIRYHSTASFDSVVKGMLPQ